MKRAVAAWTLGLLASLPAGAAIRDSTSVVSASAILSVDRLHAGAGAEAAVLLRIEPGWHVNAREPGLEYLIPTELSLKSGAGLQVSEPIYPEPVVRSFEFAGSALPVYDGETALRFRVQAAAGMPPGPRRVEGTLTVQACSDNLCLAPARLPVALDVEVADLSAAVSALHPEWFAAGPAGGGATGGGPTTGAGAEIADLIARRGWWIALGVTFLAGLALNLTPCVYPIIPITVSYFGAQASARGLPKLLLAILYTGGLALTYSSLGVVAALTGSILGASLQSPWVLGGIAASMAALALSFFGLYEIRLPAGLTARLGARRGAGGALVMGLTVGLVAAPCVGPFVIPLLAYVGASGDPWQGFWMFLSLSLGLGLPFLVLAMFAGLIGRLPRAGEWMVGVKRVFGLALLGTGVYFASPLLPTRAEPWVLPGYLLLAAVYLVLLERSAEQVRGWRVMRLASAAGFLALALALGWPTPPGIAWEAYTPEALERARAASRPVIIDFYADWCLPCKELDRSTFVHPRVVEAAASFVTLKADLTGFTPPPVEALRQRYQILAVPTVLFLDASGREPEHLRVTGYLRPEAFHQRMRELLASGAPPASAASATGGP